MMASSTLKSSTSFSKIMFRREQWLEYVQIDKHVEDILTKSLGNENFEIFRKTISFLQ
jgi:hypothetical protein